MELFSRRATKMRKGGVCQRPQLGPQVQTCAVLLSVCCLATAAVCCLAAHGSDAQGKAIWRPVGPHEAYEASISWARALQAHMPQVAGGRCAM